jgi:hypothetical protein
MKSSGTSPDATTTTTTSKKWVPGLYASDKKYETLKQRLAEGHMFLVEVDPVKVTCVICKDASCPPRRADAEAFTAKHGYVGRYLAPSVEEYLFQRLGLTEWKVKEILLSSPEIHWNVLLSSGQ